MAEQELLFNIVWKRVGCEYISDLADPWYAPKVAHCLEHTHADEYSLRAWLDLFHYVTGSNGKFQTPEEARTALLLRLKRTNPAPI